MREKTWNNVSRVANEEVFEFVNSGGAQKGSTKLMAKQSGGGFFWGSEARQVPVPSLWATDRLRDHYRHWSVQDRNGHPSGNNTGQSSQQENTGGDRK